MAAWLNQTNRQANAAFIAALALEPGSCVLEIGFGNGRSVPGESGEAFYRVIRVARKSSSHPAVFRLSRREAFPGANRIRFCAMCLIVQKLAGA